MTSQANHVTQNVARTKLAQYLTFGQSFKQFYWMVNEKIDEQNWVERKEKKRKNRRNTSR